MSETINNESPWTTCLLTRMIILYLEQIGKDGAVDYDAVLKGEDQLNRIDTPKHFLKDYNNWVPHYVLQNLIQAAENASGSKEVAYLAAKHYFKPNQSPSFLEIIARLLNNIEQAVTCSNQWATGYTNYLKLQSLMAFGANQSEVVFLSRFGLNVEPLVGNIQLIRGNIEGFARMFEQAEDPVCLEEISQLKIESVAKEFKDYQIEKKGDQLTIFNASGKTVVTAKKVFLKEEAFSTTLINTPVEECVVPPKNGKVWVMGLAKEENPNDSNSLENVAHKMLGECALELLCRREMDEPVPEIVGRAGEVARSAGVFPGPRAHIL